MVARQDGSILDSERDTARIMALGPEGKLTELVHLPQVVPGHPAPWPLRRTLRMWRVCAAKGSEY
ncbi:hypothetical protein GCM10017711_20420 [Paeniglutamicibacter sulfureus]